MVKHRIWSRNKGVSVDWNSFYASYLALCQHTSTSTFSILIKSFWCVLKRRFKMRHHMARNAYIWLRKKELLHLYLSFKFDKSFTTLQINDHTNGLTGWQYTGIEHFEYSNSVCLQLFNNDLTMNVTRQTDQYYMTGGSQQKFPYWFYCTCYVAPRWCNTHKPVVVPQGRLVSRSLKK